MRDSRSDTHSFSDPQGQLETEYTQPGPVGGRERVRLCSRRVGRSQTCEGHAVTNASNMKDHNRAPEGRGA